MRLSDYLVENEDVVVDVPAFDNIDAVSSSEEGRLACTPHRVVYVRGNDVTDISLNGVNSIEYTDMSFPKRYLNWGIGGLLLSIPLIIFGLSINDLSVPLFIVGGFVLLSGIATLVWGYFLRRSVLRVHTPNKSYSFASTNANLDQIGHTIRGYEMKK